MSFRPATPSHDRVRIDWNSPLSREKFEVYSTVSQQLESLYVMFSVNLDEALELRRGCRLAKAFQVLTLSSTLASRFTDPVLELLRAMLLHARHFGTAPNLKALSSANFVNSKSQRAARLNSLLNRVLLTQKSQFLYKSTTLIELVEDLITTFQATLSQLSLGELADPESGWRALVSDHFDLTTCFRESQVVLKSFLHAIPTDQLAQFSACLQEQKFTSRKFFHLHARHVAHRRMTLLKGQ